ncbi:MAG: cytochrome c3 family protein, partial [Planctomycetota bacterium]
DDPLRDDLLESDLDSDSSPASNPQASMRFDSERLLPAGGWYVDDLRASIRYRGSGHDDPVLKSVIELIRQLPESDRARKQLLQTRAIRSCLQCHPGAVSSRPTWVSEPLVGRRDQLTKFTHRSHINVAQLSDCQHCHRIQSGDSNDIRLVSTGDSHRPEFAHLSKQACIACHVPQAAGDGCTTCHQYHVEDAAAFRLHLDPLQLQPTWMQSNPASFGSRNRSLE